MSEPRPGELIAHPTTGMRVEVVKVETVRTQRRVYFKAPGTHGWYVIPQ